MWRSSHSHHATGNRIVATAGMLLCLCTVAMAGEAVTSEKIRDALTAKPRVTRSMASTDTSPPASDAQRKFVDSLRGRVTRSLSLDEREQIAAIAETRPKIDLEINFEYNSAEISPKAASQITALGEALSSPALKGATFVVAGYTDAVGGETYNQDLSERRADAIKRVLVEKYAVTGDTLVTVGYGKTKLKDPTHPMDPANRRVQVITMTDRSDPQ